MTMWSNADIAVLLFRLHCGSTIVAAAEVSFARTVVALMALLPKAPRRNVHALVASILNLEEM